MRESNTVEFKQGITSTFLKTVAAYANYGDGDILFGVTDDGKECGIKNPMKACLDIENKINDSIDPLPTYTLHINEKTSVIKLHVEEGIHKPYFYKSKAYIRNDSATVEVDRVELTRLILEGKNSSYEELKSELQDLKFTALSKLLKEKTGIKTFSQDTLKTLELYDDKKGYNIAAQILSDRNTFPGIDIARFGESISIILDRESYTGESILKQYEKSVRMFSKYYLYDEIKGSYREKKELIPEAAFREAIANALVHRTWDIPAHVNVAMYSDRIEVTSPGGLPKGISKEEYLRGDISIPRNYILCNVFLRLNMIERFGTGIKRINDLYATSSMKPVFEITDNMIRVILPVIAEVPDLEPDYAKVYAMLRNQSLSSGAVTKATGFGKNKTVSILNKLVQQGYIRKDGIGRGITYTGV